MNNSRAVRPRVEEAVEAFWEGVPPFWNRVRAHIRQVAAERFGISVEQFHILRHVRHGAGSVSELAAVKGISRAAISQAVDVLVGKGLICRTPDARDRRYVRLDLTAEGNALLDAVLKDAKAWMAGVFAPLGDDELAAIAGCAEALKAVLAA